MSITEPNQPQTGQAPAPAPPQQPAPTPGAPAQAPPQQQPAQQARPANPWDTPEAARAEIEKVRAEAAGYRTQVRELEPLATKQREADLAGQSDLEKITAKATQFEQSAGTAQLEAARYKVALEKGLTATQAMRLVGKNTEELEADADQLRKDLGLETQPTGPQAQQQRPTEKLQTVPVQGGAGSAVDGLPDMDAWMRNRQANT